jgi:hypothetical protein
MGNEFVTYEQALALKELGYGDHYGDDYFAWYSSNKDFHYRNMNSPVYPNNQSFIAPLKQQVFRWFREKYNIQGYIYSSTVRGNKEGTKQFTGYVWNINGIDMTFISTDARYELHDTYEEAENACIDKLIEIAKQRDNGK